MIAAGDKAAGQDTATGRANAELSVRGPGWPAPPRAQLAQGQGAPAAGLIAPDAGAAGLMAPELMAPERMAPGRMGGGPAGPGRQSAAPTGPATVTAAGRPRTMTLDAFLAGQRAPVWALIDGVNCPDLAIIAEGLEPVCLYRAPDIASAPHAPWLLPLARGSRAAEDLAMLPGDLHWGIVLASDWDALALRAHFRKFTMIRTPADPDAPGYFRFYDPRVMRDLLDAFEPEHVASLLAPVEALALPLSPQLGARVGLSPCAPRALWRDKVLQPVLPPRPADTTAMTVTGFAVSAPEFRRMEQLQSARSIGKLARYLHGLAPGADDTDMIVLARAAPPRAARYGLGSVEQVHVFARAMLVLGPDFDERDPPMQQMLMSAAPAWQKAETLAQITTAATPPDGAGTAGLTQGMRSA